jgi:hypothetical protein
MTGAEFVASFYGDRELWQTIRRRGMTERMLGQQGTIDRLSGENGNLRMRVSGHSDEIALLLGQLNLTQDAATMFEESYAMQAAKSEELKQYNAQLLYELEVSGREVAQ